VENKVGREREDVDDPQVAAGETVVDDGEDPDERYRQHDHGHARGSDWSGYDETADECHDHKRGGECDAGRGGIVCRRLNDERHDRDNEPCARGCAQHVREPGRWSTFGPPAEARALRDLNGFGCVAHSLPPECTDANATTGPITTMWPVVALRCVSVR